MLLLLYRLHIFASDQIKDEKTKQVFAFVLAPFEQVSLQKATFDIFLEQLWEISGHFLGNLEQLVASPSLPTYWMQWNQNKMVWVIFDNLPSPPPPYMG